jgi:hypothetical protein
MKKTDTIRVNGKKYKITEEDAYKAFLRFKPYNSKTMKPLTWEELKYHTNTLGEKNESK